MQKKYQNGFFIFGIIVLAFMVTQLDFAEVWRGLSHAGYWFLAVVVLWAFLYIFNTCSWRLIIGSVCADTVNVQPVPFWWLYKVTVSGFALNYATPGGLMGGEPYRIMMLSPRIGTERASSSVILYVMTHIFSHFWFWLLSIPLYLLVQSVNPFTGCLLLVMAVVCVAAIWFFLRGYKKGLAVATMNLLRHLPLVRRWAESFVDRHQEQLARIDQQIATLHNQRPRRFAAAVGLELACRIASALEVYFILLVFSQGLPVGEVADFTYLDCILIISFTTLLANILFFMPLQLGGREGGFFLSITTLGMGLTAVWAAQAAIFVALIVRVRELVWTGIGLLLIKLDKRQAAQ